MRLGPKLSESGISKSSITAGVSEGVVILMADGLAPLGVAVRPISLILADGDLEGSHSFLTVESLIFGSGSHRLKFLFCEARSMCQLIVLNEWIDQSLFNAIMASALPYLQLALAVTTSATLLVLAVFHHGQSIFLKECLISFSFVRAMNGEDYIPSVRLSVY